MLTDNNSSPKLLPTFGLHPPLRNNQLLQVRTSQKTRRRVETSLKRNQQRKISQQTISQLMRKAKLLPKETKLLQLATARRTKRRKRRSLRKRSLKKRKERNHQRRRLSNHLLITDQSRLALWKRKVCMVAVGSC